jgi:hypothetical protein
MAKKRISSTDLSWLILQQLDDPGSRAARIALAVVADDKHGWRVVVGANSRRFVTSEIARRLAVLQDRLRPKYELWG